MKLLLLVFLGGGIGSSLRFAISQLVPARPSPSPAFPFATLLVNVLGCLVIGCLAALLLHPPHDRPDLRAFLGIGLLGGFTTFSAFALESLQLASAGRLPIALLYIVLSNALCLAAAFVGFRSAGALSQ